MCFPWRPTAQDRPSSAPTLCSETYCPTRIAGWTFVTGDKTEIDSLLQRLGAGVGNKNDHTTMILIGNDPADVWTRTYGLSSPTVLIKVITDTASRK